MEICLEFKRRVTTDDFSMIEKSLTQKNCLISLKNNFIIIKSNDEIFSLHIHEDIEKIKFKI